MPAIAASHQISTASVQLNATSGCTPAVFISAAALEVPGHKHGGLRSTDTNLRPGCLENAHIRLTSGMP